MVEIWSKLAKYQATASMGHLLVASQRTSQIVELIRPILSFIPSKSNLKWLRYGQKQQNSQPRQFWESWWLARLYYLNRQIFSFSPSKSNLKWLRYGQKQQNSQPLWLKVAKQLATAILGDELVASQMASYILLFEYTNFLFFPIKI